MKKVLILVEGQTEANFVVQILRPRFSEIGIYVQESIATTKHNRTGKAFKGGVVTYSPIKRELSRLLGDTSAVAVTTMFDFYDLPKDFPGRGREVHQGNCYERVEFLQGALKEDLGNPMKFVPYLSLHEFEALLLSSPQHFDEELETGGMGQRLLGALGGRLPEEVNDGLETHPSAQIKRLALEHGRKYRKRLHGVSIASRIGLRTMREKCSHFDRWVTILEDLGNAPDAVDEDS